MKKLFLASLMLGFSLFANAQTGINSPYSQFGLGVLADQTSGFNRGMNGVGLAFHEHNQVNYINPASYSSLDSLTFIFDAGVSGQITNFSENGVRKNAKNANFEYVVAGLRLAKNLGLSFGIVPFSNVGYSYGNSGWVDSEAKDVSFTNTYSGEGGFHQVYLGAGYSPFKGFSFGANVSYFWGKYDRKVKNTMSSSSVNTLTRNYYAQVNSYKLDFGVQYTHQIAKQDWLTVGVTFSPGHSLGATANLYQIKTDVMTGVNDTTTMSLGGKALSLPTMYGLGVMWNHAAQWKVGLDYTLQKWGSLESPEFDGTNYVLMKGIYKDRHKVNLGAQYCYDERHRNFFKRVQYRAGVSYATPYYKINGSDGPKDLSVSAGFGIPIVNSYNNRSYLNISGQWVQTNASGFIKENTFRINVGFTFNEDWFKKWKMQ